MDQRNKDQACVRDAKEAMQEFRVGDITREELEDDLRFYGTQCHGRKRKHRIYRMLRKIDTN